MRETTLWAVPFPPIVFNPAFGDLSDFLAPPYDVIDAERCRQLLTRHPYNVVRLVLPPSLEPDNPSRYEEAANLWRQWLKEHVLVALEEPSLFVYVQRFRFRGTFREHWALVAALPLTDYEVGLVRPHEYTLPKPKSDRLKLLQTIGVELGQVHGLVSDESGKWQELLQSGAQGLPWLKGTVDGVEHLVWRVRDAEFAEEVNRLLAPQWLVIADGHHRYETALSFRSELPEALADPSHPANFVSFVLADYQRNTTVLPTHRLLTFTEPENEERFLREVSRRFFSQEVEWDGREEELERLFAHPDGIPFLFAAQGRAWLVSVKGIESGVAEALAQLPAPLRQVDAVVLHQVVFPFALAGAGVSPEGIKWDYTHDAHHAWQFAQREGCVAVLVRAMSPEVVRAVAAQGYRLPPKTTYFVPKVPSGLLMRQILPVR